LQPLFGLELPKTTFHQSGPAPSVRTSRMPKLNAGAAKRGFWGATEAGEAAFLRIIDTLYRTPISLLAATPPLPL
jgi:hypothetical protein